MIMAIRSGAPASGRALFPGARAWLVALVLLSLSAASPAASAPDAVGRVTVTLGTVEAQGADGTTRRLRRQDPVYEGDTLRTGPRGRAQLRFTDRGLMSLRPDTELVIDGYAFTASPASGPASTAPGSAAAVGTVRQELSLNRGGFRAMTGRIADANRSAYRVRTPLAVIGIRGTIFDALQLAGGPLLLGVAQGGIQAVSASGESANIGEGTSFDYARVNPDGSVDYLIEPPSQLDASVELDEDGGSDGSEEEARDDLGAAEESSVAAGGGDAESTVGTPVAQTLTLDTSNDPESTGTISPSNEGTGNQPTEVPIVIGGVLSPAARDGLLADGRVAIIGGVAADAVDEQGEFLLGSDRIGVASGIGTLEPDGRPLLAGALGASGFAPAFPTLGRAELLDLADALLTGDSAPASGLFPEGTFAPLQGEAGVTWGSFLQPVRLFRDAADATDFLTTSGSAEVLFALGTPTDIAALEGTRDYELQDSRVVTTGGLVVNDTFASAFLDLGTGDLSGTLDLNLAEEGTPTTTRYEYVVDYDALVRGGLLTEVEVTFAELFDQQTEVGVAAEAALTGFLTGADAEFLNLAFAYHVPGNTLFDASGVALLLAGENPTPVAGLSLEEVAALGTGIGFVAAECCFFATDGTIAGRASDPRPSAGLDALLGFNPAEGPLDPAFEDFPPVAVFRRQDAATVNYALFDGNDAIAGFEWQGFDGGPVGIFDSVTGEQLGEVSRNLLVLTGPLAAVAELTGSRRFSTSGLEQGFLSGTAAVASRPLTGADFAFNVDFATGRIFGGQALVYTDDDAGSELFFRDGFDVGFDGQVGTANANPFVDFRILGGIYFDDNADGGGFGILDPAQSSMEGFFVAGGEEFSLAFNFVSAEATVDEGGGESPGSPGFEFVEPVTALGLAVLQRELLQLTPAESTSFEQGRVFVGAGCCFDLDGVLDGGVGVGLATEALIGGLAVGPVLGINVDELGEDIAPGEPGFGVLPPERLFRLAGAEQNPGFIFFQPPPAGQIGTIEQYEWDGFGVRPLEIDAVTGDVIGELPEQVLFQTVIPATVADLTGLGFFSGSSLTGLAGGAAITGGPALADSSGGQAFDYGVSFAVDFGTGELSGGNLFVQPDFALTGETAPIFSAFFGGRVLTTEGSPFIDVTVTDGSYAGIVPLDLEASEIAGVFVQDVETYLAGSFFLATDQAEPLTAAGIFQVAGQEDQRFTLADLQALDRFGIAALANRDISGERALLPNLLLGRASAVVEGATPSFQLAANRLQLDSGSGDLGPSRAGFFDLPAEFRLDQFFAEDAPLFVPNVVPAVGSPVFDPELQISWGAWNAGIEFEARLQDDPATTNGTNLLNGVFFASVNPTPTALMPASGVFTYEGSTSNDSIAQIGAGGGVISASSDDPVSSVLANFIVDFGSGAISDGLLQVIVPGSTVGIRWDGEFSGRVQGAIADLRLDALSITELETFTVVGAGRLDQSSITGLFTGPAGERFLGGYSLDADGPLGGVEQVRGLFVIDGTPGLLPGG